MREISVKEYKVNHNKNLKLQLCRHHFLRWHYTNRNYSRLSLIGTRIREISVKEYKVNHKKSKITAVPTTFSLVALY